MSFVQYESVGPVICEGRGQGLCLFLALKSAVVEKMLDCLGRENWLFKALVGYEVGDIESNVSTSSGTGTDRHKTWQKNTT